MRRHPLAGSSTSDTRSLLTAVAQGVSAYQAYFACSEMHAVRSEYLFYEPIARIAMARGWAVQCEVDSQTGTKPTGDKPRIDFLFSRGPLHSKERIALEVKYLGKKLRIGKLKLDKELTKLQSPYFIDCTKVVLVFGKEPAVKSLKLSLPNLTTRKPSSGKPPSSSKKILLRSGGIRYGAAWFILPLMPFSP